MLNVVAFAFLVLHTVTWFNLTPQAMVSGCAGGGCRRLAIIASQYAGWSSCRRSSFWLVTR